jgi:hypothetical protein
MLSTRGTLQRRLSRERAGFSKSAYCENSPVKWRRAWCGSKPNGSGSQRLLAYAAFRIQIRVSLARYCRDDYDISLLVVKCHVNTCKIEVNAHLQVFEHTRDDHIYVDRSLVMGIAADLSALVDESLHSSRDFKPHSQSSLQSFTASLIASNQSERRSLHDPFYTANTDRKRLLKPLEILQIKNPGADDEPGM